MQITNFPPLIFNEVQGVDQSLAFKPGNMIADPFKPLVIVLESYGLLTDRSNFSETIFYSISIFFPGKGGWFCWGSEISVIFELPCPGLMKNLGVELNTGPWKESSALPLQIKWMYANVQLFYWIKQCLHACF